ncbi:MAG: hypothetical protein JNM07_04275 [Phycisphaerae bacterium]|nr:hypothetical protein [Phycisphaerae bacterium]
MSNDPRRPDPSEPNPSAAPPRRGDPGEARAPYRPATVDRRLGLDRREVERLARELGVRAGDDAAASARGDETEPDVSGLERRRGPGRRLSDFSKSAEEGEMTKEQFLFLMAIEAFKRSNAKGFPTWTDVLEVVRLLGYRKTCGSEIRVGSAEDWTEPHNAPANVRPDGWERRFRVGAGPTGGTGKEAA